MDHAGGVAVAPDGETKLDRLAKWHRGETPGPWTISFYPTYRCNIRCKICWKQAFEEPIDRDEEVPKDRMLSLVDEAAELGVQDWIIGGGGELSLRSAAVFPMFEKIREYGMNGIIQTNFTRWTDQQLERLVEIGWHKINVSLDGPTREINDAIRDKNDFDRVVDAIARIEKIKKERGKNYPLIQITSVVTNLNFDKLRGFIDLSTRLGKQRGGLVLVDLIEFGPNDKEFLLSPEQRAQMPDNVRDAINYAQENGVDCYYWGYLEGIKQNPPPDAMDLFSQPEEKLSPASMCFEPFQHMVIMPEGTSGPCCTFHDPGKAENIWNRPLKDVWLGEYMQESRRRLLQGTPMEYCKECMLTRISANRETQGAFGDYLAERELDKPIDWSEFLVKAGRSLQRHGLTGSIKRGREWLDIRNRAKQRVSSK